MNDKKRRRGKALLEQFEEMDKRHRRRMTRWDRFHRYAGVILLVVSLVYAASVSSPQ